MFSLAEATQQLTFPEIMSVLLKRLPRPQLGVLHISLVISDMDNTRELNEVNMKKDNRSVEIYRYQGFLCPIEPQYLSDEKSTKLRNDEYNEMLVMLLSIAR